jgi:hypothetical protein
MFHISFQSVGFVCRMVHNHWLQFIILLSITNSQHTKTVLTALNMGVDFALGETKS